MTSLSRHHLLLAQITAVASFIPYALSQTYVLFLGLPDIPRSYTPNSFSVATFFVFSAILNCYWLSRLFVNVSDAWILRLPMAIIAGGSDEVVELRKEQEQAATQTDYPKQRLNVSVKHLDSAQAAYTPFYVLGNIFLTAWSVAWLKAYYTLAQFMLIGNLVVQMCAIFILLNVETQQVTTRLSHLTHFVVKTNAGLGVLYMWKNWGLIDKFTPPTIAESAQSGIIFLLMTVASGPDPTLGICLLFDLSALVFGQGESELWHIAFLWMILAVTTCLLVDSALSTRRSVKWFDDFEALRRSEDPSLTGSDEKRGQEVWYPI
ncbi:hypothetical protein B0H34DRAFT_22542 [Crassisporium funariophilum]|nr:hypothetical protein B0H34DRAFT_22542 [Crassisporium funariophilum]